jgi:hypothetical protein
VAGCGIKAHGPDAVQAPGRIAWSGDHRRDSSQRPAPPGRSRGRPKKAAQNGSSVCQAGAARGEEVLDELQAGPTGAMGHGIADRRSTMVRP